MKMFSNAWKVCLLLLPMLGSAEEYVVATRLDESLVVPTATMLTSDWTNSVLWLTADSPVVDEGTTNATWLDFSPEHNDATQTDTDKQPDRVYTNGAWAWEFDGVDDSLSLGDLADFDLSPNRDLTLVFKGVRIDAFTANRALYDKRGDGTKGVFLVVAGGELASKLYYNSGSDGVDARGGSLSTGTVYDLAIVVDRDGDLSILVDGALVASGDISAYAATDLSTATASVIGNKTDVFSSLTFFDGSIEEIYAFPRALTTNEIQEICQ